MKRNIIYLVGSPTTRKSTILHQLYKADPVHWRLPYPCTKNWLVRELTNNEHVCYVGLHEVGEPLSMKEVEEVAAQFPHVIFVIVITPAKITEDSLLS